MTVAVLSSIYGDYDERSAPPPQTVDAEWILVTDVARDVPGWTVVVEPRPDVHPRLAAKVAKCLPWHYTEADITVWMDGACQLLHDRALEGLLAEAEGETLTQFVHPWRDCIYTEAEASTGMPKYAGRALREQVGHYRKGGHPADWGLWATGLIVRDRGRDPYKHDELGHRWLAEQVRWTYQDQLSEAVVLRKLALWPHTFAGPLHGNGYVAWANHRDEL